MSTANTAQHHASESPSGSAWWSHVMGRISRFIEAYIWLSKDAFLGKMYRVTMVGVLSFLGAIAVSSTLVLLSIYIQKLEVGEAWIVPGVGWNLGAELSSLWVVAIIVLVLQIFSAITAYFCAVQSRAIARSYQYRAGSRMLQLIAGWHPIPGQTTFNKKYLGRTIKGDPRLMAKAAESMMGSVQLIFYAFAYIGILFFLDVRATIYVLPLFLVSAPVLYFLGGRAQQASTEYYGRAREGIAGAIKQHIAIGEEWGVTPDLRKNEIAESYYTDQRIKEYWDYYDRRQLTSQRSALVTSLLRPLMIVVILIILGSAAIESTDSWGSILIYILALAQLGRSFTSLAAVVASMTDSYPRIRFYRSIYFPLVQLSGKQYTSTEVSSIDMKLPGSKKYGGVDCLTLRPGKPTLFSINISPARLSLGLVTESLVAATEVDPLVWYTGSFIFSGQACPILPLQDILTGSKTPSDQVTKEVEEFITNADLKNEIEGLPQGRDTVLTQSVWATLSPNLKVAVYVLGLSNTPGSVALVEWDIFEDIDAAYADKLIAILDQKIVLFVSSSNPHGEEVAAEQVIWAINGDVLGMGDHHWWDSMKKERTAKRKEMKSEASSLQLLGDDDDDDL